MTKEETISNLKAYLDGDTAIGNIIPLRSVLESAIKYLDSSLPSNLDEVAEEQWAAMEYVSNTARESTSVRGWCTNDIVNAFKAGVEWMAGQGVTKEAVIGMATKDIELNVSGRVLDKLELGPGDKVIIQIRRTEQWK